MLILPYMYSNKLSVTRRGCHNVLT